MVLIWRCMDYYLHLHLKFCAPPFLRVTSFAELAFYSSRMGEGPSAVIFRFYVPTAAEYSGLQHTLLPLNIQTPQRYMLHYCKPYG
jgi:hypothetical protein